MGIRPHLQVLCGINDLKFENNRIVDSRYKPNSIPGRLEEMYWQEEYVTIPPKTSIKPIEKLSEGDLAEEMCLATIRNALLDTEGQPKQAYEVLQWGSEYDDPHIIGYILDSICMDYTVNYALASLHPDYQQSGAHLIPSIPAEKTILLQNLQKIIAKYGVATVTNRSFWNQSETRKRMLKDVNRQKLLVKNNWNYALFSMQNRMYYRIALWLFKWIGLHVKARDLKLMLYVDWS